jgi:hypothetical protein
VLVEPHGISASFAKLYSLYMVGYLFNNILPTSVGGDAIRAYELGKCEGKKQEALASVFMERFTGLTTLIVLALLAVYLDEHHLRDIRLVVPLGVVLVGYVGIGGIVFNRSFVSFLEDHVCRENVGKMTKKLREFQEAIYMYQHHWREIIYAIGYSILFYANCVLIVYVGCLVFDVHVSIGSLIMAVPVMFVLCLIPISVGGIGVKEWAYYLVLGMIGVPGSVGLSIALMDRAMVVGFGLLGGAIYPLLKETQKVKGPAREFRTAVE